MNINNFIFSASEEYKKTVGNRVLDGTARELAALNGVASDSELKIWARKFRKVQSLLTDLRMASPAKKKY